MLSIKEEKETHNNDSKDNKNKNDNLINKKYFQKTFTNGFHKPKSMFNSKSEIFSPNKKYPKLKQILLHEGEKYGRKFLFALKKLSKIDSRE